MSAVEYIAGTTLTSTATSVTFSSIPASYRDLRLTAMHATSGTPTLNGVTVRLNSDSGSNYSNTRMRGTGTNANSDRVTNYPYLWIATESYSSTQWVVTTVDFLDYCNTVTFKSCLSLSANSGFGMFANVGLWRSTAAITSVQVFCTDNGSASTPFVANSTFSLWGVK